MMRNGPRVPTVAIEIDGALCDLYGSLYEMLVLDNPSLLRARPYTDVIRDLAESCPMANFCQKRTERCGAATSLLQRAYELAEARPYFYLSLTAAAGEQEIRCLDDFMTSRDGVVYAVATRRDLPGDVPAIVCDARVAAQDWLWERGLRNFIGIRPDIACRRQKVAKLLEWKVDFHLTSLPSDLDMMSAAGIRAYLVDRPWNRDFDTPWRVDNIEAFLDLVKDYAPEETAFPV